MHGIAAELNKASDEAEITRLRRSLLAGGWLLGFWKTRRMPGFRVQPQAPPCPRKPSSN